MKKELNADGFSNAAHAINTVNRIYIGGVFGVYLAISFILSILQ